MASNDKLYLEPMNEDTVQCLFFSVTCDESNMSQWVDLCQQINNTIKMLSKDYIWNKDEFLVHIPLAHSRDTSTPLHLKSITSFGDNLEDEWFIVHLVLEISKLYKNIIIQITDNDGDFLLIEAADHLQTWASPENTENRVFIHNNLIHIIPPGIVSLESKVQLNTALNAINEYPDLTIATTDIQQAILRRIGNYPDKILKNTHRAVVHLPTNLAALLVLKPSLIAPIIDAFCNHDVVEAKACKKVDFIDCVTIDISFTKFLYAKLMHSDLMNCVKHSISENDKRIVLGSKLMCGFQIIMSKASTDMFSSKDYLMFINSLKKNGYFKDNMEGSKEYKLLLERAKEYFSIVECSTSSNLCHNISKLMVSDDFIHIKKTIKDRQIVDPKYEGDNEDWLNIDPKELNDLLLTRYGKSSKLKSNDIISSHAVTTELSSFLKQTSDFEGIEPDRREQNEDHEIEFESDQFVSCIEKMLKIISSGDVETLTDECEDSDDDYGSLGDSDDYDNELKAKLQTNKQHKFHDNNAIFTNIIQSMKEEGASTGPTSNLLRSIGVQKSDLLDSDDED